MAASTHGIELRSDALAVRLDPRLGGRITSLEDTMGFEYMARGGAPQAGSPELVPFCST